MVSRILKFTACLLRLRNEAAHVGFEAAVKQSLFSIFRAMLSRETEVYCDGHKRAQVEIGSDDTSLD